MNPSGTLELNEEDVTKLLIQWLRNPQYGMHTSYGYEVYLPSLAAEYRNRQGQHPQSLDNNSWFRTNSSKFYAAAWELCRRGILRPGISHFEAQATPDGASGNGYSITPFGRKWLAEATSDDFVPTEPGRFAELIEPYREKFGEGFYQRAQEAINCYGAHSYLACCAMCGAAAESILLTIAIAKSNNEKDTLKKYYSAGGRQKIENLLIGQAPQKIKDEFKGYNSLLSYWRDESAHGKASTITETQAFTATAMLLRLAIFIDETWEKIIHD